MSKTIIIIGAGLAGLSAALQAAEKWMQCKTGFLPSVRAGTVCYGGGRYQRSFEYKR